MGFKEKYTFDKITEPNKILISIEYYAVCELLDELIIKLEKLRHK